MARPAAKPELSEDEILRLLQEVLDGQPSPAAPSPVIPRPGSPSEAAVTRELSLDEILRKVQRDIEEGRPTGSG
jgi:hypothetical protein